MMNEKYYKMPTTPPLKKYAFLGNFLSKLGYLSSLAEHENWRYDAPNAITEEQKNLSVLYQYIFHTFSKAQEENYIVESETHAIMNTGLLTQNGEEIYMLFVRNSIPDAQKWYFSSFFRESAHEIPEGLRASLPNHIDYFKDKPEDMYFNVSFPILANMDHIITDQFERVPNEIRVLGRETVNMVVGSAFEYMKKKILRNNRLVIPQYYNKQIMYLAPLQIGEVFIPLAIEKHSTTYRVNTIFTAGMAYCNARLIMKPESNWLINKESVNRENKKIG